MALSTVTNQLQVRDNATFALTPAKSINAYKLVANTAINVAVSALVDANTKNANCVIFSCNADFYVLWEGDNAAVPAGSILTGLSPELNPTIRRIAGLTKFSIVAPADCILTMSMFTLQN